MKNGSCYPNDNNYKREARRSVGDARAEVHYAQSSCGAVTRD